MHASLFRAFHSRQNKRAHGAFACLIVLNLASTGCSPVEAPPARQRVKTVLTAAPQENLARSCPDRYNREWDYFPDKVSFQYSKQLSVSYRGSYKVITFAPSIHPELPLRYVLYQCGTPRPAGFDGATFIQVPVQRAVLNSPTLGSTVAALGVLDRLYGVNDLDQFTNPAILRAGEDGRLLALGTRGPSSIEKATTIDTDVVFLFYSANPTYNLHPVLRRFGVGAVGLGDIFESSPLGRAEWGKFFSLFFNEEKRANTHFDAAARRYLALVARAGSVSDKPAVLLGFPWTRDTWTASGGGNCYAQLVRDAGGQYFLSDDRQPVANLKMPFEKAIQLSSNTTIWIATNGLNWIPSKRELLRRLPMLENIFPVYGGSTFSLDSNTASGEALPFVDSSLDKPDVLLADVISVLHPELLPGYQPVFIRKLI